MFHRPSGTSPKPCSLGRVQNILKHHGSAVPPLPSGKACDLRASFVIVGALWINHHRLLAVVRRATPQLMWMNLLLLFFMSLIPLATGFLGEHPQLARAIFCYALTMTLSSAVFDVVTRHANGRWRPTSRGLASAIGRAPGRTLRARR